MAKSKVSMKLLIDKNAKKVLFAEAGKDTVDFLFSLLALPVGTVISLLSKKKMVGCVANLYDSVENLGEDYIQPNQNKDTLLKPRSPINDLLMIDNISSSPAKFYICGYNYNCTSNYYTDIRGTTCGSCGRRMETEMTYWVGAVGGTTAAQGVSGGGGFVKGVVTYMVMDNLVVKPMSTISSITLLNQFNVKDVGALEEKLVDLDITKGLQLLKESLNSKAVLTSVFLSTK